MRKLRCRNSNLSKGTHICGTDEEMTPEIRSHTQVACLRVVMDLTCDRTTCVFHDYLTFLYIYPTYVFKLEFHLLLKVYTMLTL